MAPEERILLNTVVFALGGQEPVRCIKAVAALITVVPISEETVKGRAVPGHIHQVSPPITDVKNPTQHVRQPIAPIPALMKPMSTRQKRRDGHRRKAHAYVQP